jgi:hypothetical protein
LNLYSLGNFEDRLEANAFFTNVSRRICLGTFAGAANSTNIGLSKPLFVRIDDQPIVVEGEVEERSLPFCRGSIILIVFGVLDELVDESGIF